MRDDRTHTPGGSYDSDAANGLPDVDGMPIEVLRRYLKNLSDAAEARRVEAWASESDSRQRYLDSLRDLLERAPMESRAAAELAWARLAARLRRPVTLPAEAQGAMQPLMRPSALRLLPRSAPSSVPSPVRSRPELVRQPTLPRAPARMWTGATLPTRRGQRSTALLAAAAVLLALAGSTLLGRAGNHPPPTADSAAMRLITTAVGQRAEIRLSDGTRVALGVASRLRLAPDFGERSRDLYLDGTAYFDVVHDSTRPFRVHTSTAVTQDVGTRFVISAYSGNHSTQVVVASGEVTLRAAHDSTSPPVALRAGHLARITPGSDAFVVRSVDPAQYTAWMEGRLVFRDAPLSEVVAELHRWYDVDVRIGDSALASMPLSASFSAESFRETLNVITTVLPLRAVRRDGVVTLYRR